MRVDGMEKNGVVVWRESAERRHREQCQAQNQQFKLPGLQVCMLVEQEPAKKITMGGCTLHGLNYHVPYMFTSPNCRCTC